MRRAAPVRKMGSGLWEPGEKMVAVCCGVSDLDMVGRDVR